MKITQGDSYDIPVKLLLNGETFSPELITRLRLCFGNLKKEYPEEVIYEEPYFMFPLSQEESLKMHGLLKCEAHIQFKSGDIRVVALPDIIVGTSLCKEMM